MSWETPLTLPCGLTLPNRVVMAPMTTFSSHPDGTLTEAEFDYYQARATDRPGAIITACAYIQANGTAFNHSIGVDHDGCLPGLTRLAQTIKAEGVPAILQIFHAGRMGNAEDLVAPSAIPAPRDGAQTPRELSPEEIRDQITAYGDATRRAITAGFDGVEIHGANTYGIQQFFSPHSNRRTDEWGGETATERLAFPAAVITEVLSVRDAADRPFAVGYRVSPEEIEEPGITLADTDILIDYLVGQPLDYLSISTPNLGQKSLRDPAVTERAIDRITARVAGRKVVMGAGGLGTEAALNAALATVDLAGVAHQYLYDYRFLTKIRQGRETDMIRVLDPNRQPEYRIPENCWNTIASRGAWFTFASPAVPPVVSAAFLAENPGAVIVDSRWYLDGRVGRDAYAAGHLPGAVFVDLNTELAAPPSPTLGRHPLPTPEAFAASLSLLGIMPNSLVIAYDDCGGQVAARLVWMLRILGVNAALLDGGLSAWTGELETKTNTPKPSQFPVTPWPTERFAEIDEVDATSDPLIDARAENRFRGEVEPIDPKAGHIPGATCLPCSGNLVDGFFRTPAELADRFAAAGITPDSGVISYCGSGITACHNLLALERAGFSDGRLYVGSWSQWSHTDREVAQGS